MRRPGAEEPLLRRLRVHTMAGGLLDDPALLALAASEVAIDVEELRTWCASPEVEWELTRDVADARRPSAAARALNHKLGGPAAERRYTAPSYELTGTSGRTCSIPGFNPVEAYETAIANLAPGLERRPAPSEVEDVLVWADEPLATVEVAAVMQREAQLVRGELARVATPLAAGADMYWTLGGP